MDTLALYKRLLLPIKLLTALALGVFAWRIVKEYQVSGYPLLLLVLVGEAVAIGLVLLARSPAQVVVTPRSVLATLAATLYFLVVSVKPAPAWLPPVVPGLLVISGILIQVSAKLYLGRCFGLLPAVRGIVVRGPYKVVRHPIYAGYLCTHVGLFLVATSWYNLAVFSGLYVCQFMRILEEERVLSTQPEYAAYKQRVRWRLVPGLF